ncbi:MAG TPA: DUF5666 domain-containing protein [Candidatus Bathyarchaeia archaeon]|nr:DUF5666 domain-containing protein [Candidatus Bathyarchaeia archaeon]
MAGTEKRHLSIGVQFGILAGAIAIAGGAGFFGGEQYQKSQIPTNPGGNFASLSPAQRQAFRNGSGGAGFTGRGGVTGTIISKDDTSITVKSSDGSTHIVYYNSSTPVNNQTSASANDLAVGKNVTVGGMPNSSNGSTTASRITITP